MIPSESEQEAAEGDMAAERRRLFPSLDRFNAFSDGVFAIAITLLVLELPVPAEDTGIWVALGRTWRDFVGYLISFAFIGGIWLTHAGLTKVMRRGDSVSYGVNLILLLFVALLPFSTKLMVAHVHAPDAWVGVFLYGVNVLLASLTLSLLLFYVAKEPGLVTEEVADEDLRRMYRRRWAAIGLNVFALAMAVIAPLAAVALYLVMTGLALALPLLGLGRRRRSRAT
jgi:uncharacterized membrane protein